MTPKRAFVFILVFAVVYAVALRTAYWVAEPVRDPRCDTPARYQAMSEGKDCS